MVMIGTDKGTTGSTMLKLHPGFLEKYSVPKLWDGVSRLTIIYQLLKTNCI
jgi:hypothetical protein